MPPDPEGTWRSVLFPKTWKPDFTGPGGLFVHDFSYAGYRNSEESIPSLGEAAVFSVVDYGAAPNQDADSTAGFQSALDAAVAAGGGVVFVPAGLYRCDGLLSVKASNVVLRGEGPQASRIYFTRHDTMTGKAHISFTGSGATDIETALVADGEARLSTIAVEDASQLAVGDDISIGWVITDDFIAHHSMTGTWAAFNGTWQPFFRREIVGIDTDVTPNQVTVDVPLRYPALVADGATVRRETGYVSEVAVEGLGLSNAVEWNQAWANERSHVLSFSFVKDGWIRNVETFESPISPSGGNGAHAHLQNSGLKIHASKRFTVEDTVMEKSQNRGGGGCGYLFEVRVSNEILFVDCTARAGRHNFIQNWGFGVTGCVWLRCFSEDGFAVSLQGLPFIGQTGFSEFHHSLATGNLIDSSTFHDGFKAVNRQDWSTGAGHTATQNIFWNNSGNGKIHSRQWDWGCIIGTSGNLDAVTSLGGLFNTEAEGTEPEDFTEGLGQGETLYPSSLFEEQLLLRLGQ